MPCDSIYYVNYNIDLGDWDLLEKALKGLEGVRQLYVDVKNKYAFFYHHGSRTTIEGGKIRVEAGDEALVATINTAYGRQVIQAAKQRFGAELRQTATNKFKLKLRN